MFPMIGLAERWCFVVIWSLTLPLVGYSFFVLLTLGVAGLGLLIGLKNLIIAIYIMGFVPTVLTGIVYEYFLRRHSVVVATIGVCIVGIASAWVWWSLVQTKPLCMGYGMFAMFAAAALSVALMPVIGRAWEERKRKNSAAKEPS